VSAFSCRFIGGISAQQLVKDITEIVIEQQSESLRILNIIESELETKKYLHHHRNRFIEQELFLKDFFIQK
jgi:polyphosphate kinase